MILFVNKRLLATLTQIVMVWNIAQVGTANLSWTYVHICETLDWWNPWRLTGCWTLKSLCLRITSIGKLLRLLLINLNKIICGNPTGFKVCPYRASVAAEASASPLEYIVMLENWFPSVTVYSNGDAAAAAATDARCGQTLNHKPFGRSNQLQTINLYELIWISDEFVETAVKLVLYPLHLFAHN